MGEPVAEGDDQEDAPEAAGAVDDVGRGSVSPVGNGGDDEESLEVDEGGAKSEVGPDGTRDFAEGLLEAWDEDEGVDSGKGSHDGRKAADAPGGGPSLDEDVEAGVGCSGNEGAAGGECGTVHAGTVAADAEERDGEGCQGGRDPDLWRERVVEQEPGEEGDHEDLEAEHGRGDRDVTACEGKDGGDLPGDEEEGDDGGLPEERPRGNLPAESQEAGEGDGSGDVGNESDSPDIDGPGGGAFEEQGAEGVEECSEERQPEGWRQEEIGGDGGVGCQEG